MNNDILVSQSTINLNEIIESIREQLLQKKNSQISTSESINLFSEIKPLSIYDFEQELLKYNVSLDRSYIKNIVAQINGELFIQLLIKTGDRILQSLIASSNDLIQPLTSTDLIHNYGLNFDDEKTINTILTNVNAGIKNENKIRNREKKYKRLTECFIELAKTEVQKDAIEQIMKNGEYKGFRVNSMLSNKVHDEQAEIKRRIAFAEMILHDENLFFYLVNNGINVFHGTKIEALPTILSKGLFSSLKLDENGIQLATGEGAAQNKSFGFDAVKRDFVSLTDDFDTSASYACFHYEEQDEFAKRYLKKYQREDTVIPIIICFKGSDIKQKYSESIVTINSDCNEIGVVSSISPADIKCIITSYDKIEYVKSIVSKYGIDVLGYDHNDRFEKRLIDDKEGKFYSSNLEIDEQAFEEVKKTFKVRKTEISGSEERMAGQSMIDDNHGQMLKESNRQLGNHMTDETQKKECLSEELSMKIAASIKMDIIFDLTEQYNNGIPFVPITASGLITRYNMNEAVAQRLAAEINEIVGRYVEEKECKKIAPYGSGGGGVQTNSTGGKSR